MGLLSSDFQFVMIDVESVGLFGGAFSVGWARYQWGNLRESGYMAVNRNSLDISGNQNDMAWVNANVPELPKTHDNQLPMLAQFATMLLGWRERNYEIFADCAFPVETNALAAIGMRQIGPNPFNGLLVIHDLATVMLMAGMDYKATYDRLPDELPKHHPENDAKQSGRLLLEAIAKIKEGMS